MHDAVRKWVEQTKPDTAGRTVLEFGALDINGTVRDLFGDAAGYVGVDLQDGPGVDVIGDAATWQPDEPVDVVVCTEVFEHCRDWPRIVANAFECLAPGGVFIATMAGPGRPKHSALREPDPDVYEFYRNVEPDDLEAELWAAGFVDVRVDRAGLDVRCVATRG